MNDITRDYGEHTVMSIAQPDTTESILVEVAPDLLTALVKSCPTPANSRMGTAPHTADAELEDIEADATDSPTEDEVFTALEEAKIAITDAVKARVAEFIRLVASGKAGSEPFMVATGEPPQHGQDEKFVWDKSFEKEAIDWQDDAAVNYYTLNSILTVDKDTTIGTIAPAVQPRDGVNVKGRTIPAEGSALPLQVDKSIVRPPDDPSRVITSIPGKVIDDHHTLQIIEVLKIDGDIGFETGNVDSTVDVHISGQVPDCFEVKSARAITVGASIEAAEITACGDVVVRRGILGRRRGLVTAGGQIIAKFGADANLVAAGDVKISAQLMNCRVCVGGKLIAAGASVIGGGLYGKEGVEAAHLGSDANVPTRIVVGVRPEVVREVATIDRRVKRARELIDGIRELVQPLLDREKQLSSAQAQQASDLLSRTSDAASRIAEDEKRRQELLENVYVDGTPSVRVSGMIHQGVTIRIGNRETAFHNELKGPVSIERRKIKNVTELVAVSMLSGSVKILTAERRSLDELLDGFELEEEVEQSS